MMWLVRARVRDSTTGDELDLRTKEAATEVRSALERADAGDLAPLPADASPFRRFEVMSGQNGWFYITRAEGALDHEPFGPDTEQGVRHAGRRDDESGGSEETAGSARAR
jgi:hypothetical protein